MDEYCIAKIAPPGSICYYSASSLVPSQREATLVLLAFFREIQDIPLTCREPQVAMAKLAWWYDELLNTVRGQPTHPASLELDRVLQTIPIPINELQIPLHHVQSLVTGAVASPESLSAQFAGYFHVYPLLTQYVFGSATDASLEFAQQAGRYLASAHSVIHHVQLIERGYASLYPGITMDNPRFATEAVAAPLHDLLKARAQQFNHAVPALIAELSPTERVTQRFTVTMLALTQSLLKKLQRYHFDPAQAQLLPITACWHAWRTVVRLKRGARKAQ